MLRLGPQSRRLFSTTAIRASAYVSAPRKTLADISRLYSANEPISVVTAWDSILGLIADDCGFDITLVGDSLAMVALGYEDTNEIGLTEMLFHARAVTRANQTSLVVADMPFGTFEQSPSQALQTATRYIKEARVQAVKIEGGVSMVPTIKKIVGAGIPVMGHVGLTPQKHNALGGYKLQGNTVDTANQTLQDCKALEEAGVFSIVLECIPNKLSEIATSLVNVPTIGIGAGSLVSGQVLVMADLLGMQDKTPAKFVKKYMDFYGEACKAVSQYRDEVKTGAFPDPAIHGYKIKSDVLAQVREFAEQLRK